MSGYVFSIVSETDVFLETFEEYAKKYVLQNNNIKEEVESNISEKSNISDYGHRYTDDSETIVKIDISQEYDLLMLNNGFYSCSIGSEFTDNYVYNNYKTIKIVYTDTLKDRIYSRTETYNSLIKWLKFNNKKFIKELNKIKIINISEENIAWCIFGKK